MRLLCIHPGASISTADIYYGFVEAFQALGHHVDGYLLDRRIDMAGGWLKAMWLRSDKQMEKPTPAHILYWAGFPAIEMALRTQPDYVICFSGMYFPKYLMAILHNTHLPTAICLSEDPYDTPMALEVIPYFDAVFTNERTCLPALRAVNPNTFYLPHAYRPSVHYPVPRATDPSAPAHDVVFVGTGFEERCQLLSAVDWTDIDFGLYGTWDLLGSRNKLRQHIRGGFRNNDATARLYRNAKIGLNLHRTSMGFGRGAPKIEHAESLNPRAYELAACGLFHLSDARDELTERFGYLVPTFTNAQELGDLLRTWLPLEDKRRQYEAELPRAVAGHTFLERAKHVLLQLEHVQSQPRLPRALGELAPV